MFVNIANNANRHYIRFLSSLAVASANVMSFLKINYCKIPHIICFTSVLCALRELAIPAADLAAVQ